MFRSHGVCKLRRGVVTHGTLGPQRPRAFHPDFLEIAVDLRVFCSFGIRAQRRYLRVPPPPARTSLPRAYSHLFSAELFAPVPVRAHNFLHIIKMLKVNGNERSIRDAFEEFA